MAEQNKTLIFGSGPCARDTAAAFLAKDTEIILAAKENDAGLLPAEKAEILTHAALVSCEGTVGNFVLTLARNGENISRTAANVIIAEEAIRQPNFSLYGLESASDVISLSQLLESLSDDHGHYEGKKIVFLTGLAEESHPVILEDIMRSSLKLQSDFHAKTYVLTKNLKVGGNGLEALFRTTKKAGTVYIKFTDTLPEISQETDGHVTLTFTDEVIRETFRVKPDVVVVDETLLPSDYVGKLAAILGLDTDPKGFVQADNVHRLSVFTNRKGILASGPSRGVFSPAEVVADAGNAVISALKLGAKDAADSGHRAEIDSGMCAMCLTCYRTCPYQAIVIGEKMIVMPDACERCGACAAACPGRAITMKGVTVDEVSEQLTKDLPQQEETFIPFLVAFCCNRSASQARELALEAGHDLPRGLKIIEVPCAGSISDEHLFSAFQNNADGVLVLTCHEGNCHSEHGNIYARKRTGRVADILSAAGVEKERIAIKTLASNMAKEFAEITKAFEQKILDIGPGGLS